MQKNDFDPLERCAFVRHGTQRFLANSIFRFNDAQIADVEEYWAAVEPPPAWRTAASIGAYQRTDPPA